MNGKSLTNALFASLLLTAIIAPRNAVSAEIPNVRWVGNEEMFREKYPEAVERIQKLVGVRTVVLYEARADNWKYNHHPYITAHAGVLYALWSNGKKDEDAIGQRCVFSISRDKGKTWTPCAEAFPGMDGPSPRGNTPNWRSMCANGFAVTGNTIYLIGEFMKHRSVKGGLGRLARPVNAEGHLGPIFWLRKDAPKAVHPAYPDASNPQFTEVANRINAYLARPEHWPSWDFRFHLSKPKAADGHQLCEPTQAWHRPDGTYVRFYRDLGDKKLKIPESTRNYVQFSFNNGATWTPPVKTEFPDTCSRSAAGMLPDGTAYVINNPARGRRDPLVISLAKDGLAFNRHAIIFSHDKEPRFPGRSKVGGPQYVHATVFEGALFAIYSVGKEEMCVSRIPLEALEKLPVADGH